LKKQIEKYLKSSGPWLPIYVKLEKGIDKVYGDLGLKQLLTDKLKSNDEKILLIQIGLDEYSGNGQNLLQNIDDILDEFVTESNNSGGNNYQ
jgi:hypothetical protein